MSKKSLYVINENELARERKCCDPRAMKALAHLRGEKLTIYPGYADKKEGVDNVKN